MFLKSLLCCYLVLQFSVDGYATRVIHIDVVGDDAKECCQLGNCPCSSLDAAFELIDPAVENITIEIKSDIHLNATHDISGLNILVLTGYYNVICGKDGGVEFRYISTLILELFTWKGFPNSLGAVSVYNSSLIVNSTQFTNFATRALAIFHCCVIFDAVLFGNNKGAAYISSSNLTLIGISIFSENVASIGGAIYFTNQSHVKLFNATVYFFSNKADILGGAIYAEEMSNCDVQPQLIESDSNSQMVFADNVAVIAGNSWYFEINTSCNFVKNTSNPDSLVYYPRQYIYSNSLDKEISSSLYQLKLSYPAKCTNTNSRGICTDYELHNIMPGQEIKIPAKMLGYYGHNGMATEVLVNCSLNCDDVMLNGDNVVLVFSDTAIRGIRIRARNEIAANITLQLTAVTKMKPLIVYLMVEISRCTSGYKFVKQNETFGRCMCYEYKDIVKCLNDSTAQIKQGYWVGTVKELYTTAMCPTRYCDFNSCNDCVGYCLLPHNHDGQCRHHKTGPACGVCKSGYVLPFDSIDCVESSKCSAGITVLLIILIITYWFVTVTVIIVLMNFLSFQVGYAYGVIYFYSIIDVLVGDDTSDWPVFQFTTILSGFAKMTPEFLGSLCFVDSKEWSGIDQQIIRYIHPIAVLIILLLLSRAARCSIRLSWYISRSIIRSICLVLLLAYTSVVLGSLELLRPLTFSDVDDVYVYCSPDIGYFRGRHIAYGVLAILGTIIFVIGLPLLLLLEPLCLNRYLSLVKIKPLLDQYQGCFKHKYRYFAAYYLFCRVAILVVIYTETNYFNRSFILQILCIIIAIIHGSIFPYKETFVNVLDLIILLITVFAVGFNSGYSFTTFHSPQSFDVLLVGIVIAPLICFLMFVVLKNCKVRCKLCTERDFVYHHESINDEDGYYDMRYSNYYIYILCGNISGLKALFAVNICVTLA